MIPRIGMIPAENIDDVWDAVAPLLQRSQRRISRIVGMEDMKDELRAGSAQLWSVIVGDKLKAVIMTEVQKHPRSLTLKILHVAGYDVPEWGGAALKMMERFGRDMKCSAVSADGRLGWSKYAKRNGWKEAARLYEMEL